MVAILSFNKVVVAAVIISLDFMVEDAKMVSLKRCVAKEAGGDGR